MPEKSPPIVAAESTQRCCQQRADTAQVRAEFESRLAGSADPVLRLQFAEFLIQTDETLAAAHQYEQLLAALESTGRAELRAVTFNQLACLYRRRGDINKATVFQRRSLRAELDQSFDGDLAPDLGNLAADAIARGELSLAEKLLRRSLTLEIRAMSSAGQAADYGNLAVVHELRGEYQAAIGCLRLALCLHRRLHDVRAVGCDLLNLATVYAKQQRSIRARIVLELAVRVFRVAGAAELEEQAEMMLVSLQRLTRLAAFDAERN